MQPHTLPIAKPPWTRLGKKLESATRKALFEFDLIEGLSHIGVALSGGKDSLALLFLLNAIRGRGFAPFKLTAFHIAGEFSCGASVQKNYLKRICDALDVELVIKKSSQKREGLNCYRCSRERRKLIFDAAKATGATTVAFGHHRDDLAQTLLMNMLHKGEFTGMLPKILMIDYGITIIRPLIYIDESQIIEFAKNYGFARITCQCPVGQNSMRKKVDALLTDIEELFPHARANVASAALYYGSDKSARR